MPLAGLRGAVSLRSSRYNNSYALRSNPARRRGGGPSSHRGSACPMTHVKEDNKVLREKQIEERKPIMQALAFALLWGAVTYGYAAANLIISHDSLFQFLPPKEWKIGLGRVFEPVYLFIVRGNLEIPWIIGILATAFIALAVYALAKALDLSSAWDVLLTAGAITTIPSTFLLAVTYICDLDSNMLALLCAVLAVAAWGKGRTWYWLLAGACLVAGSLGIYQSYLSVTVTLVIVYSVKRLLDGDTAKQVFLRGLAAIGMLALGLVLYSIAVRLACLVARVELKQDAYNSLTNAFSANTWQNLGRNIRFAYRDFIEKTIYAHFGHEYRISAAQAAAVLGALAALVYRAVRGRIKLSAALLMVALIALLPLGASLSGIANGGTTHDLMRCGNLGIYVLLIAAVAPLRRAEKALPRRCAQLVTACMLFTMWQLAVDANQLLVLRTVANQATQSVMTCVSNDMMKQEDYVPGETPVYIYGNVLPDPNPYIDGSRMEYLRRYTGIAFNGIQITYYDTYKAYFRYLLQRDVKLCTAEQSSAIEQTEAFLDMPDYPKDGSIRMIDGVLVVKLEKVY